ncbi:enoyl-CoA hydratase-related protein [Silvanigrella paludirubra]|jgi:methylglutaconyl-CoA hydratase|nr:enoyl-CoA hydratase-related protein [Silvanigrella paludirubra]
MNNIYYSGKCIRVESLDHGVKKLILTRSDIRNAFNESMIKEISTMLSELSKIENVNEMRLLILEGEGKVFCAGADLNYMKDQSLRNLEQNKEDATNLGQMFYKLASFPCPVISLVQGAAIGGGFGLVACSDFTLAEENAIFATSEVLLGIVPGVISPYIIRKIGVAHASSFLLNGKKLTGKECLISGLVNKIADHENLKTELNTLINSFLLAGPNAARRTKELIINASPFPNKSQFDFTVKQIAEARSSNEGKAGILAFFEKNSPYWCNGITK